MATEKALAPKRILTIQDISCVGQCSLTVALPVISAFGVETAILPAAVLSVHTAPGFRNWTFRDLTEDMALIEKSWMENSVKFDAFYTGYVCESQIGPILDIMKSAAAPGALKIVDPAMADNGKLYAGFNDSFPMHMRRLCAAADYILPNLTEAALLLGREPVLEGYGKGYVEDLLRELALTGAKNVILTGVSFEEDKLGFAAYDGERISYGFNQRVPLSLHGTGDLYASCFTGALMRGEPMEEAAQFAADMVCAALERTPKSHWYGPCFESALPLVFSRYESR